jgi:hypothetical protein
MIDIPGCSERTNFKNVLVFQIGLYFFFSGNFLCSLALSEHASTVMDVYQQLVPKV